MARAGSTSGRPWRAGQRRRPGDDARLLPADVRRVRQPSGADAGVPPPPGHGDAAGAGDVLRRARRPRIAGALCLRGGDTLYGRYWGASEPLPGLHFETCYYQGIDYCLREGLTRFEPGAQGEHKLARGFLPTLVRSRHWIAHRGFRDALRGWCAQEAASVRRYAATPGRALAVQGRRGRTADPDDAACACRCCRPIPPRRFPPVARRCAHPDGLLAIGGDLSPAAAAQCLSPRHLSLVFRRATDPVVVPGSAHGVPHRWRAPVVAVPPTLRRSHWTVRADTAFEQVIDRLRRRSRATASAAPGSPPDMLAAYCRPASPGPCAFGRGVRRRAAGRRHLRRRGRPDVLRRKHVQRAIGRLEGRPGGARPPPARTGAGRCSMRRSRTTTCSPGRGAVAARRGSWRRLRRWRRMPEPGRRMDRRASATWPARELAQSRRMNRARPRSFAPACRSWQNAAASRARCAGPDSDNAIQETHGKR